MARLDSGTLYLVILWYSAPSLISRMIRRITRSPYSHVAVMLHDAVNHDRDALYEALGSGVAKVKSGEELWERIDEAVAVQHMPVGEKDFEQVGAWLDMQVGRSYSLTGFVIAGLTSLGLPVPVVALNRQYVCSSLVGTALEIAGYFNPRYEPRLETPGSLAVRLKASRVYGRANACCGEQS